MWKDAGSNPLKALSRYNASAFALARERVRLTLFPLTNSRFRQKAESTHPELIVSMTSVPARAGSLHLPLLSILCQSLRPSRVILWISEDYLLPRKVLALQRFGLEVRRCQDVGPHTKFYYAFQEFPESIVVLADDDQIYERSWLAKLFHSYESNPRAIHCHRAHHIELDRAGDLMPYRSWKIGSAGFHGPCHRLFPTGCSGILFPPKSLCAEVFNLEMMKRLCPTNDDIWLKGMALLTGTSVKKVAPNSYFPLQIPRAQTVNLFATNVLNNGNDKQLGAIFGHYDLMGPLKDGD